MKKIKKILFFIGLSITIYSIYKFLDNSKMYQELNNINIYKKYKIKNTDFSTQYIDIIKFIYRRNSITLGNQKMKEQIIKYMLIRYSIEGKYIDINVKINGLTLISEKHNYQALLEKLKMYGINYYDYDIGKYYCFELENVFTYRLCSL